MKRSLFRICLPILLLYIAVSSPSVSAQIGFQAELFTPPSFVSSWVEPKDQFSAAIYPKTYAFLSTRLKHVPRATYSSFDKDYIRFETEYYSRGRSSESLIPVAVDARAYSSYRRENAISSMFTDASKRSLNRSDKSGGAGGLGISVDLPARLNRIFGEGGAGLKVSGFRRISFAGRSTWTDASETDAFQQSKFPSLSMEQISRFDITGNIGSKITVKVSQDSQTDIPLANSLQIRYKGDDDDVLKSIEAGNTTLSLPNTQFVGYSSNIQGLFGVKAVAQVGGLSLTGIASQEKGSTERASFTPTGEEGAKYVRDYEYVQRRIFDLGRLGELKAKDSVTTVFVYESETQADNREADFADLFVNPNFPDSFPSENVLSGDALRYTQLSNDYTIYNEPDRNRHYIVFNAQRSTNTYLGVWMVVKRFQSATNSYTTDTVGNINSIPYKLKLLCKPESVARPTEQTWNLMWRNCYAIDHDVKPEDIDLKIYKGLPGTEGNGQNYNYETVNGQTYPYLQVLGMDQYNSSDKKTPDLLLDNRQEVFRPDWGLIIFPSREPFASDTTYADVGNPNLPKLQDSVPAIYNYNSFDDKINSSEFYLQLTTKVRSSTIKLNRANIIEGSEKITLNGRQLVRGTDYNIQYDFGQITLLTDEANDPNANLSIDYEYAPFFAVQKKSLLGTRAEYALGKDFKIGTTFLYKSDKAQDRKPKVGQETAKMLVYDADMSLKLQPNFLTKAANALPLVATNTPSNLSIAAEVAQSHPNPNVNGAAYIDDFETALDQLSLGTTRTSWHRSPRPYPMNESDYQRGKLIWYSPENFVPYDSVYKGEQAQGNNTIRTMRMVFRPDHKKIEVDTSVTPPDTIVSTVKSWDGIMRYFNSRVDAKRAQLFEVRLKGNRGKIHFDFGKINEDINGNRVNDTEDKNQNGSVDESEDTGIDGKADPDEPGYNAETNPDPDHDDFYFHGSGKFPLPASMKGAIDNDPAYEYEWINGTEGNKDDPGVLGLPDQEALSSANGFNQVDAYFSFVLDMASDSFLVDSSTYKGWRTYRIPIRDSLAVDQFVTSGTQAPDWGQISHVRIWFDADENDTLTDTVDIANWYFVQSNWQDSVIYSPLSDSSTAFYVASVSDQENSNFTPPPGVTAYKDPSNNVTEAQKALLLNFKDFNYRDTCLTTKDLLTVDQYSGYRELNMYVYGGIEQKDVGKVKFFFRLGRDAKNYYEYQTMVHPGWDPQNYVTMDFNQITALKDAAQKALPKNQKTVDTTYGNYRVYGDPNINEIRYFAAGIVNLDSTENINGELWMDELRVTEVRKDVGNAGRLTVSGSMADLLSYSFNYQSKDPYFRGLSSATRGGSQDNLGSGRTETSYNYSLSLNLDKLLPRSWGARLPISYSFAKSVTTPLLRSNSDIVLPPERRREEQSRTVSKSVTYSASFQKPGRNPLFSLLLNRLKTSGSYRRTDQVTVTTPYSFGEAYNIKTDYDLSVKKVPVLPIFFWTKPVPLLNKLSGSNLGLYPERWTTSANYSRNLQISDDVNGIRRPSIQRDFTGNMDVNYKIFDNLGATYHYDTRRDLSDLDLVHITSSPSTFKLGLETSFNERMSVSYDPKLFGFFTSQLAYKATYGDTWQQANETRKSIMSRSAGVTGKFDHMALLGGKSGGSNARRFRGRAPGARRAEQEKTSEQKVSKPFYDPALGALRFLTGWIQPLQYSYSESYNNSLPGMVSRPSWKYRFGLQDNADVPLTTDVNTQSAGSGKSYDLSSGFTLFGGVTTTVRYRQSITRDLVKQGPRYEQTSTNWPDLTIRIQKFKTLPLIRKYINSLIDIFSPRTGYSHSQKKSKDIEGGYLTSRTTSTDYSPYLSINFKVFRALSLSASYSGGQDSRENYNPSNGTRTAETITSQNSFALTSQYSFSAPGGIAIPLFGRMKFRSTVDINVTIKKNNSKTETDRFDGLGLVPTEDKSDFSVSPVISYTFSQQMKGGLTVRWQDANDKTRNRKSHTREVQLWTEIRF